jgi:antitoxin ChpS
MYTTHLRKVGGSIMLAVPPAILELLNLKVGTSVDVGVDGDRLVIEPRGPRYSLDELLAQCDPVAPMSSEDKKWVSQAPVGDELI